MDIIGLIEFVSEHWGYAATIFGAGAMWYQGAMWFKKVNYKLEQVGAQHKSQDDKLDALVVSVNEMKHDVAAIKAELITVHEEVHEQEIKLAVLENTVELPVSNRRKNKA
jgi:septal ring factor EnvC (AmiA/AmiB activator)